MNVFSSSFFFYSNFFLRKLESEHDRIIQLDMPNCWPCNVNYGTLAERLKRKRKNPYKCYVVSPKRSSNVISPTA